MTTFNLGCGDDTAIRMATTSKAKSQQLVPLLVHCTQISCYSDLLCRRVRAHARHLLVDRVLAGFVVQHIINLRHDFGCHLGEELGKE